MATGDPAYLPSSFLISNTTVSPDPGELLSPASICQLWGGQNRMGRLGGCLGPSKPSICSTTF